MLNHQSGLLFLVEHSTSLRAMDHAGDEYSQEHGPQCCHFHSVAGAKKSKCELLGIDHQEIGIQML